MNVQMPGRSARRSCSPGWGAAPRCPFSLREPGFRGQARIATMSPAWSLVCSSTGRELSCPLALDSIGTPYIQGFARSFSTASLASFLVIMPMIFCTEKFRRAGSFPPEQKCRAHFGQRRAVGPSQNALQSIGGWTGGHFCMERFFRRSMLSNSAGHGKQGRDAEAEPTAPQANGMAARQSFDCRCMAREASRTRLMMEVCASSGRPERASRMMEALSVFPSE